MLPITRRNDGSLINDRVERIELLFFSTYLIPSQRSVWTSNYSGIRPYFKLLQRHEKFMLLYPVKGLQLVLDTLCEYLAY